MTDMVFKALSLTFNGEWNEVQSISKADTFHFFFHIKGSNQVEFLTTTCDDLFSCLSLKKIDFDPPFSKVGLHTISSSNFPHFILHYRGFKLILSSFLIIWKWIEFEERLSVMGKSNEQDLCLPTRLQGRTKWKNCWIATKNPDYQNGWAILAECSAHINVIYILCT